MSETIQSEKAAGTEQFPVPPNIEPEKSLSPAQWGIIAFLASEVALFGTLITTYLTYMGQDFSGPYPKDVLSIGVASIATPVPGGVGPMTITMLLANTIRAAEAQAR